MPLCDHYVSVSNLICTLLVHSDTNRVAYLNARDLQYLASATQCAATQGESAAATPLTTSTKVPYSGAANNQADRKRRRLWTPEEDLALIAAVDKCGEGNWATVLKNHYDFDRSASQLSQVQCTLHAMTLHNTMILLLF